MKIYTKKGDEGITSLLGGKKVSKSSLRVIAYGKIDTVMSSLGIILAHENLNEIIFTELNRIMHQLFLASAIVATDNNESSQMILEKRAQKTINNNEIIHLEEVIDDLEAKLTPLKNFIMPTGTIIAANLHFSRCLVREAECLLVELYTLKILDVSIIKYFNRLSDFLFVLARFENQSANKKDKIFTS